MKKTNNSSKSLKLILTCIFFTMLFALTNVAGATTFYVRIDGNDSCSGLINISFALNSEDCSWKSITHALEIIQAGDTVKVQSGIYDESPILKYSGNATHQIKVLGDGNPILDSFNTKQYGFFADTKEYYTIDGFTIQNYNNSGIYIRSNAGHNVNGDNGIKIGNNTIKNIYGNGIWIHPDGIPLYTVGGKNFEGLLIENNTISNITCEKYLSCIKGAIWMQPEHTYYNTTIRNNIIHNTYNVTGIYIDGYYGVVQNNTLYNIGYNGISTSTYVSHNIIKGNRISNATAPLGQIPRPLLRFDTHGSNTTVMDNIITNGSVALYQLNNNSSLINNTFKALTGFIWWIGNDNRITNNTFDDAGAITIIGDVCCDLAKNNIISGNTFKNGATTIVLGVYNNDTIIRNNIFYNISAPASGTIYIPGGTGNKTNIRIENNVFYKTSELYLGAQTAGYHVNNIIIKNNIFANQSSRVAKIYNPLDYSNVTASYNLIWGNGSVAFTNITESNNIYNQNPLFADVYSQDFYLKSQYGRWDGTAWVYDSETSPAIDAGDPASDNSRSPWGGIIEMGAYGNTPYASRPVITGSGSASGTAVHMNLTPIPSANVSLYYQNGAVYGQTVQSGADGRFTFSNIPNGYYYAAVDKHLYRQNTSSVFNINSAAIDIGTIKVMYYDVNGDNNIDVLDLNMIGQRINEITGTSYPSVDVNGDGIVNIYDVTLVSVQIEE